MSSEKYIGPIQPGSAGQWGDPVPFDEAVENIRALREAWQSRPEEIEAQRLRQEGEARRRQERLRAKGKDSGVYGPPDPRKGRLPMTR
jgi:hypothetical protein